MRKINILTKKVELSQQSTLTVGFARHKEGTAQRAVWRRFGSRGLVLKVKAALRRFLDMPNIVQDAPRHGQGAQSTPRRPKIRRPQNDPKVALAGTKSSLALPGVPWHSEGAPNRPGCQNVDFSLFFIHPCGWGC